MDTLLGFCIKSIARDPANCLTAAAVAQAKSRSGFLECSDMIVTAVTDAGKMSDAVPAALFEHPLRRQLTIRNSKLSDAQIRVLIASLPQLEAADLSGVLSVQDETVLFVLQTCRELRRIDLTNCRKLTDQALVHLRKASNGLTSIKIGGNFNVRVEAIAALVDNDKVAGSLREFRFSGVDVPPSLVHGLSVRCGQLCHLGLSYTTVNDALLEKLLSPLTGTLESLCVAWNSSLVSQGLLDFLGTFPRLQNLDVNGLKVVTVAAIQDFLSKRQQSSASSAEWSRFLSIRAKFVGSSKAQVDQLAMIFPAVHFDT